MSSERTPPLRLLVLAVPLLAGCGSSFWLPPPPSPGEIPRLEGRLQSDPDDAETAVRLAQAYRSSDRLEEARSLLERTVERHPGQPAATLVLGITYEDLGRFGDARRLYRSYIDQGGSPGLRRELENRLPLLQRRELEAAVRDALVREAELANTAPRPHTVAVFPFLFVGEDPQLAPLGRALAELLVTDLSQTSRMQVLERAQVQLLLDEMRLAEEGVVDPSTAARTGRILGAERVVQGSMDGQETELRLETSIVRVSDSAWPGEAAPSGDRPHLQLSETDALAQLIDMQKRLALRIYSGLGVQLTEAERERITRRPTENIHALLAFGRGLESEDAGAFAAAASHFAEAVALDPGFAEARESAERATAMAAAEGTDTDRLAADAAGAPELAWGRDQPFLPDPFARDAAMEILRTEGFASPTVLELILRRPQGAR